MLFLNVAFMVRLRSSEDPYKYLTNNGFTNQEALHLLNRESEEMDLEVMGRLVTLLHCTVEDVMDWNGDPNHMFQKLKKPTMDELERMLEKISPDEVLTIVRGGGE